MDRNLKAAVDVPCSNRSVWVYSRSSEPHPRVLFEQTQELLSFQSPVLKKALECLQDYGAVLITTGSDLRYELCRKGLEAYFCQRAARKGCGLPWEWG